MNINQNLKLWLLAALLAMFLSACATTDESVTMENGDGAPVDGQAQDGSGDGMSDTGGAAATGLDGSDGVYGTAIADDTSSMSAAAMLDQTDGDLADRTVYFEYDSAKLTSESIAILETHGNFLASNGEVSVRLEGHSDERGSRGAGLVGQWHAVCPVGIDAGTIDSASRASHRIVTAF